MDAWTAGRLHDASNVARPTTGHITTIGTRIGLNHA
jgi:hypothetical protein